MLTEAYLPIEELIKYYKTTDKSSKKVLPISHIPINFDLVSSLEKPEDIIPTKVFEYSRIF